jgi:hypothetical protein
MGHIYRLRQKIEPVLANPLLLDARSRIADPSRWMT